MTDCKETCKKDIPKILEIHKIINDPTVNKRLLGEYLNLIS